MRAGVHGFVHDDVRHLSDLVLTVAGHRTEPLIGAATTPISGVFVHRVRDAHTGAPIDLLVTRKRWIAGGLREEIHVHNTGAGPMEAEIALEVGADFAHLFEVKAGRATDAIAELSPVEDAWVLTAPHVDECATRIRCVPRPDEHPGARTLRWLVHVGPRSTARVCVTVEAIQDGTP